MSAFRHAEWNESQINEYISLHNVQYIPGEAAADTALSNKKAQQFLFQSRLYAQCTFNDLLIPSLLFHACYACYF